MKAVLKLFSVKKPLAPLAVDLMISVVASRTVIDMSTPYNNVGIYDNYL